MMLKRYGYANPDYEGEGPLIPFDDRGRVIPCSWMRKKRAVNLGVYSPKGFYKWSGWQFFLQRVAEKISQSFEDGDNYVVYRLM